MDRLERLSKSFPPDLIGPIAAPSGATLSRSFCVYPLLDTKSLSVKPCRTDSRKLRLVPPFEKIAPLTKPATLPGNIR